MEFSNRTAAADRRCNSQRPPPGRRERAVVRTFNLKHHWPACANMTARGAPPLRAARGPDGIRFAPQMIGASGRDHAARFFWSEADDCLPDIARAHRPHRHRRIGGVFVSVDIIMFIPRPKRGDMHTDFPAIAFRSTRRNLVTDPVDASSDRCTESASRDA